MTKYAILIEFEGETLEDAEIMLEDILASIGNVEDYKVKARLLTEPTNG